MVCNKRLAVVVLKKKTPQAEEAFQARATLKKSYPESPQLWLALCFLTFIPT